MSTQSEAGAGVLRTPALRFEEVQFRYASESPLAVNNVDLELWPGEVVAVVGRNGSGKSTLARLANGLLRPEAGQVFVGGLDTAEDETLWQVRARVGLLFQDPDTQIVGATVADDVAFGLENLGMARNDMVERVQRVLEAVGLQGEGAVPVQLLSGGEKQRLALAGVLVLEPQVLILDEPTSMLDRRMRLELRELIRPLVRQGTAVLWITQHMEETLWADRLVALDSGRVVYSGEPVGFFREGWADKLSLEAPPAAVLAGEVGRGLAQLRDDLGRVLSEEDLVDVLRSALGWGKDSRSGGSGDGAAGADG